ncbi:hypothetical protein Desgi_2905 [Desulfoscipio gibsoniae DSM 7213]|uniref:Uncharacterized protein n=1 Tax=Desulfoscipio gibsoniae DSM 7213 TaxID=767817 RepID=R4KGG1_9FIRM|nr:hypothetical protein Desgi_2905 [Desulfoscipio gibsoniae DSM 7213]
MSFLVLSFLTKFEQIAKTMNNLSDTMSNLFIVCSDYAVIGSTETDLRFLTTPER